MARSAGANEILQLRERYMRFQNAEDAEGCIQLWDEDCILMPPNEPSVHGKEALRLWYQSAFQHVTVEAQMSYGDIHGNEQSSFANGTYRARIKPKAGGDPVDDSGKFLEVHRRQPDGTWKFARHMWSSDRPGS